MTDVLGAVRSWSASQRGLRAVVALGPVVAVLAAGPAGEPAPWWWVAAVVMLAGRHAVLPDSGVGVLVLLLAVGWWVRVPDDGLPASALAAAAAVLAAHVAALVAASAPPDARVDVGVLRSWVLRGVAVLAAAPVLWLLARALGEQGAPAGLWPAGLLAVLLAVAAAASAFPPGAAPD
ncbi:hypothetical protein [Nocardioides sp. 1609]|uniref:hypothetical protein n=1 Tax=Nocardioides sp. 1609 TaxID=2508327 RepID=UPI00106FBEAC|nr:hypothetical protein [Nocardioides sp. 1609]